LEEVEREGVTLLLPMWDDGVAPGFGWQTAGRWEAYAAWMKEKELIEADLDPADAFTNEFVEAAS
jgi:hypothetical protein